MKHITMMAAAVLLASSAVWAQNQRLINGDFEQDPSGGLPGWTTVGAVSIQEQAQEPANPTGPAEVNR